MDVEELLLLKCLNLNKIIREYISLGLDLNLDIISEKYNIDKNKVLKSKEKVKEIVENCKENRIDILGYFDSNYPLEFRNLKDFPLVIYKKGNLSNKPKLAVVGTRQPTKKAIDFAKEISICAIENNYTIISGLAVGIDTIAHNMSIEKKFETTAILPSNLTNIYPKININLSEKILDNNGCLLTEYNFLDEIKKYHFINRDRLQAAYSLAVIVIESTKNGGTMHTANFTKKYGKKLLCVKFPKNEGEFYQRSGNNKLLKDSDTIPIENITSLNNFLRDNKK